MTLTEKQIEFKQRFGLLPTLVRALGNKGWLPGYGKRRHTSVVDNLVNCALNYQATEEKLKDLAHSVADNPSCCGDIQCELFRTWSELTARNKRRAEWLIGQLGPEWKKWI